VCAHTVEGECAHLVKWSQIIEVQVGQELAFIRRYIRLCLCYFDSIRFI